MTVGTDSAMAIEVPEVPAPGAASVIWRYRWIIAGCVVAAVCLGALAGSHEKPVYRSSARLFFEQQGASSGESTASIAPEDYLRAQVEVAGSVPVLNAASLIIAKSHLKSFESSTDIYGALKRDLKVESNISEGTVTISFTGPFPQDNAVIANTVCSQFLKYHAEHLKNPSHDLLVALSQQRDANAAELASELKQVADFESQNPMIAAGDSEETDLEKRKLAKLTDRLTDAQAGVVMLNIKCDSLANHIGQANTSANRAANGLVDRPADGPTGTPAGESVEASKSELDSLAQARAELGSAQRGVAELQDLINAENRVLANIDARHAQLAAMQATVKRTEKTGDLLLAQMGQLKMNDSLPMLVHVLDEARPATTPTNDGAVIYVLASAIGLLAGIGLSLGLHAADSRLRSSRQIRDVLRVPVLGVLHKVPGRPGTADLVMAAHSDSAGTIAEAVRSVRSAVFFIARSTSARTILVTSPNPGEGRTTVAGNLAISLAQSGSKTLLLEADFYQPRMSGIFEIPNPAGLSDVLSGKVVLERAISRTSVERLEVLTCGTTPQSPSEVFNSDGFHRLLKQLSLRYQSIVLDSPPVVAGADARILSAVADLTILVVRADSTRLRAADQAVHQLLNVGARILGAVVNDVKRSKPLARSRGILKFAETFQDVAHDPLHEQGAGQRPALKQGLLLSIRGSRRVNIFSNRMESSMIPEIDIME